MGDARLAKTRADRFAVPALWAGFSQCDVQVFSGKADRNPAEASEVDWRTLRHFAGLENQYPRALGINLLSLDGPIETRALRLRITHATTESHPHLNGKTMQGKRIWLGELVVLCPLGDKTIESALPPPQSADASDHPPIPVPFNLKEPGLVTLVIEDSNGRRVRNLISETPFPAGDNVAWWDGLDDVGRDLDAARHGLYSIPGQLVPPGSYRVRGLWRKPLDLRFEFSVYNSGHPAWETLDSTGAWLANHTPPSSALFLPADRAPAASRWFIWEATSPKADTGWRGLISTAASREAADGSGARGPAPPISPGMWEKSLTPKLTLTSAPRGMPICA